MNNEETEQNPTTSATENLIPVFTTDIGGVTQSAVNARELHGFLGVKRDYSTWIKKRISEYGFVENSDYSQEIDLKAHQNGRGLESTACEKLVDENLIHQNGGIKLDREQTGRQHGGDRRSIEYHLTLDMAKELAMVEKNEKGRQARRYFINCERQLHAKPEAAKTIQSPNVKKKYQYYKPLKDTTEYFNWLIHQTIMTRTLFLALDKMMQLFIDYGLTKENWDVLIAHQEALSTNLNQEMVRKLTIPESELKREAIEQFIRAINEWNPPYNCGNSKHSHCYPEFQLRDAHRKTLQ